MKSITLLALLLICCNSNTKQDETQIIKYGDSVVVSLNSRVIIDSSKSTDAVYDSVGGSFEFADTLNSAMTTSSFAPRHIRLLITGSNEDNARLRIKFTDAGAIPPQMKRVVAITHVGSFSISFTTVDSSFIDVARKYGTVFSGINPTPDYHLYVDDRYDIAEVAEYLKHEAGKRNNGLHHD